MAENVLVLANEVRLAQRRLVEVERRVAYLRQEATLAHERAEEAYAEAKQLVKAVSAAEAALVRAAYVDEALPIEARRG